MLTTVLERVRRVSLISQEEGAYGTHSNKTSGREKQSTPAVLDVTGEG